MTPPPLPAERAGRAASPDLAERRMAILGARDAGAWRTDPPPEDLTIGGVRVLRFTPPKPSRGIVLHLHGGAFRMGCPEAVGPFAAALAVRCSVTVVCPQYRLAPEHPYPAGLIDARAVLAALSEAGPDPLVLSGDSAGGGLAASLTALWTVQGRRLSGLALLSPWLDLTLSGESLVSNAKSDPLFSAEAAGEASDLYLQGHSAEDANVSPLLGSVKAFPPTFINVGGGEVLADDARRFRVLLRDADVPARLQVLDGMDHVAVTRGFDLRGARETFDALAEFVDRIVTDPASAGPSD